MARNARGLAPPVLQRQRQLLCRLDTIAAATFGLIEGVIVAERVREAFEGSGIVDETGPVDTTVSIGVAGGPAGTELEVLLAAADTALYQAKRGGRNRVEAAEELPLSLENWRRKTAGIARQPHKPAVTQLA